MKKLVIAATVTGFSLVGVNVAAAWSSAGIACVTKQGYQPADWEAYSVPPGPAGKIRACLARVKAAKAQ
jgi:hypothetical protein